MSAKFLALSLFFLVVIYGITQWNLRRYRRYPKYLVNAMDEVLLNANNLASESTSEQPLVALAHSSEALGLIQGLRTIAPEDDLEKLFPKKYVTVQSLVRKARKVALGKARVLCT